MFQIHELAAGKHARKGRIMSPVTVIKMPEKGMQMVNLLSCNTPGRVQFLSDGSAIIWNSPEHKALMTKLNLNRTYGKEKE